MLISVRSCAWWCLYAGLGVQAIVIIAKAVDAFVRDAPARDREFPGGAVPQPEQLLRAAFRNKGDSSGVTGFMGDEYHDYEVTLRMHRNLGEDACPSNIEGCPRCENLKSGLSLEQVGASVRGTAVRTHNTGRQPPIARNSR